MAVGDVPVEPRVIPSLKQAWANIWPSFWTLLAFAVLTALANGALSGGNRTEPLSPAFFAASGVGFLLTVFLGVPLGMGVVKAHLAVSRGQKPTWSDFGYAFGPRYWPSVGLGLLTMLVVLGGLLLLIVPGIYWGVRLAFANQRFVEDGLGPRAAMRASFADTQGRWWNVFGLVLMAIPLAIAGLLALIVGIFVAAVLISQMQAVYWRSVQAQGAPATVQAPASPPPSARAPAAAPAREASAPPASPKPAAKAPKKSAKAPAKKAAKKSAKSAR